MHDSFFFFFLLPQYKGPFFTKEDKKSYARATYRSAFYDRRGSSFDMGIY